MHLYTFATLCFFKITLPRNYYYCNQDDTFPWVCVLKYVSNSNCCHRHLKVYISMFKSFHTYRKYIYQQSIVSRFGLSVILGLCSSGHFPAIKSDCLSLNTFNRDQTRNSQSLLQLFIHLCMGRYTLSLYLPLDGSPRFT